MSVSFALDNDLQIAVSVDFEDLNDVDWSSEVIAKITVAVEMESFVSNSGVEEEIKDSDADDLTVVADASEVAATPLDSDEIESFVSMFK